MPTMMSQRKSAVVGVCLLVMVLGGCLSEGNDDSLNTGSPDTNHTVSPSEPADLPPAEEPKSDKSTGSIVGQVATEDYEAVPGASVRLYNSTGTITNVSTDDDGEYTLNGVVPGRYNLEFNAECCREDIQNVVVEAGEVSKVSSVLEVWRSNREPYIQSDEWTGFLSWSGCAGFCFSSPDPNHDDTHRFEIVRGIDSLVVAIDWDEDEGVHLQNCIGYELRGDMGKLMGTSLTSQCHEMPVEFRLDAGLMWQDNQEHHDFGNWTEWPVELEIFVEAQNFGGTTEPPNWVFQKSFTVYWQEHYWQHAPEDESALPPEE